MTKREWVRAAFHGLETDYVPICFWKHVPRELWQEDKFIKAQVDFCEETDVDSIELSTGGYFGRPTPALGKSEQTKDLHQVKAFGPGHPFIKEQIYCTKKTVSTLKGECCRLYLIFCPPPYLKLEIGYPRMMELIREDSEAVKRACRVIAGDIKLLVGGIIEEAGCDGILHNIQDGEVNRSTCKEYREQVTPSDKEVLGYANTLSGTSALHCCAWEEINNRLEDWSDYDPTVASWPRYTDGLGISQARDAFKRTVRDGFDNRLGSLLYSDTKEEIQVEAEALIEEGEERGFIIGPDCSTHNELPLGRTRWVVEAARSAQQNGSAGRRGLMRVANEYQVNKKRYEHMEYGHCGKGGLELPYVSLNLWRNFGSKGNCGTTKAMYFTTFDHSVTHFDLVNNYGPVYGNAEESFGRIMENCPKPYREELLISTKVGYDMWSGPYEDGGSRKYLISSLDASLKRMKLGYVGIFYYRRMNPDTPVEETVLALEQIVRSGRVLYAGISNYDREHARKAMRTAWEIRLPLAINQDSYSIFNRTIEENGLKEYTVRDGMGIIAFSPLVQRMLTEKYINGIPADSRIAGDGGFPHASDFTAEWVGQIRRLDTIARERRQTLIQMALSQVLRDGVVTSVLIGASRPEQITESLGIVGNTRFFRAGLGEIDRISK